MFPSLKSVVVSNTTIVKRSGYLSLLCQLGPSQNNIPSNRQPLDCQAEGAKPKSVTLPRTPESGGYLCKRLPKC